MIIDHRFTYSKLKELFLTAPFPEHFGVPCELVEKKHQRTAWRRLKRLEVDFCAGALLILCVTFVLASLLSLMLLLNLTVGFGLTGGAGAIPLLRVILILNVLSPRTISC